MRIGAWFFPMAVGLFAMAATPLWSATNAQVSIFDDRLARLEERLDALQKENMELKQRLGQASTAPDKPVPLVISPAGKVSRLMIGGFLQGQAEFGDAGDPRFSKINNRIYFRRARIYVAGRFAEQFDFKAELDLQGNTLSAGTGHLARANEIYIGWNRYPGAIFRLGQLKPAFGAEQLMSDTVMPTIERHLGSDRLTDGRQLGVSLAGVTPGHRFGYLLMVGQGNGSNVSANDNDKFLSSVRGYGVVADGPEIGRLVMGAGILHSDNSAVTKAGLGFDSVPGGAVDNVLSGSRAGWSGDLGWHRDRVGLSTEYLNVHYRPRNAVPVSSFTAQAWQVTASYFLLPERLQGVIRHERFDPNDTTANDETRTWTLGFNYLLKGNDIKLQLNYLWGDSPGLPGDRGRILSRIQIVY